MVIRQIRDAATEIALRRPHLSSSIKEEVKKNTPPTAGSFLASQPAYLSRIGSNLPHHVLGAWPERPRGLDFPCQRFSSFLGDEAHRILKPAKQNGRQVATMVLSETRGL
jgi:hypothetical protein